MSFTPRQIKSQNKELYLTSIPYNRKLQRTFTNEEMSSVPKNQILIHFIIKSQSLTLYQKQILFHLKEQLKQDDLITQY
ncbi:unnamed protein product [Paramecium sonneborni]|uniref:Uncharacterized protein n=1 Tax=Paramecium sonneborni TaxID=65129 RepID=A0A8S1RU97_9CILI|nr:unnamed protein product [Paramecium sonneborni]